MNNVIELKENCFQNSAKLTKVEIGSNLEVINAGVFSGCTALTEIIINKPCTTADQVPVLANTNAIPTTCTIYVPDSTTQSLFKSATNWIALKDRILVKA
jgi:hypothetical protein